MLFEKIIGGMSALIAASSIGAVSVDQFTTADFESITHDNENVVMAAQLDRLANSNSGRVGAFFSHYSNMLKTTAMTPAQVAEAEQLEINSRQTEEN